jgi:hypothetical protein
MPRLDACVKRPKGVIRRGEKRKHISKENTLIKIENVSSKRISVNLVDH